MIQTHIMIFWAPPMQEDFETSVRKGYDILSALKNYGNELSPNYLTAYRKKEAKRFDFDYDTFKELLKKGVNKEGKLTFPDLGYSTDFFSSFNDNEASGISLQLGTSNEKFNNNLVIDLPDNYDHDKISEKSEQLLLLFNQIIDILNPYYAMIVNNINRSRSDGLWNDKKSLPTTIHWVNFWNNDIVRKVKEKKILKADLYLAEKSDKGYFLQLKEKPIDDDSEEDINLQKAVNKKLGL